MKYRTALISLAALSTSHVALAADAESLQIGRCEVPSSTSLFSRSSESLPTGWVTKTIAPDHGDSLPALMVDGWEARKAPADLLLRELMTESGYSFEGPGPLPMVQWTGEVLPLEGVVEKIVSQFGGHWVFDGTTLRVQSVAPAARTTASFELPQQRDIRLATIDILRAYDLSVSVSGNQVFLEGDVEEMKKARKALADARSITVLDVFFLKGRPSQGRYDWSSLGAIKSKPNAAGGAFVFTDPEPETLIQRLVSKGDLVEESVQSVAAPAGWGLAVPPSQCGMGSGEVIVTSKAVGDKINLSLAGSSFDAEFPDFVLGSTAASVKPQPDQGWIRMVVVRPRVVTFSLR